MEELNTIITTLTNDVNQYIEKIKLDLLSEISKDHNIDKNELINKYIKKIDNNSDTDIKKGKKKKETTINLDTTESETNDINNDAKKEETSLKKVIYKSIIIKGKTLYIDIETNKIYKKDNDKYIEVGSIVNGDYHIKKNILKK